MKYFFLILSIFCLSGCNPSYEDTNAEDYDTLFPFGGIDKPNSSFEDLLVNECNPSQALKDYSYMGVTINDNVRDYTVTLKVTFHGSSSDRFVVKYINNTKELKLLGSSDNDVTLSEVLKTDVQKVVTFKVKSGYPMYLSVNGLATEGSNIKASISAVSDDGFIVVPELACEIFQNQIGFYQIYPPYCQFIILP